MVEAETCRLDSLSLWLVSVVLSWFPSLLLPTPPQLYVQLPSLHSHLTSLLSCRIKFSVACQRSLTPLRCLQLVILCPKPARGFACD